MSSGHSPLDRQFRRLMDFDDRAAAEETFAELLRQGASIHDPLCDFIINHNNDPRAAILLELLGRLMDERSVPVLLGFLESGEAKLRRAAVNAFGWLRSPAALEGLDSIEGNDPDEGVRLEARQAIEEILRDYPRLRDVLRHHHPSRESGAAIPKDLVPTDNPDHQQKLKLVRALPRLLAIKYVAMPLHFSPNHYLHLAVRQGSERRLIALMAEITGCDVELHPWPESKIRASIETFYTLGDDDFCTINEPLPMITRDEIAETILTAINPKEPSCPLDEANDAVEAAQSLLTAMLMGNVREARVNFLPPSMSIELDGRSITAPREESRERLLRALRILARIEETTGLHEGAEGTIRIESGEDVYTLAVRSSKAIGDEKIIIRLR